MAARRNELVCSVFISHATKDVPLVQAVVDLIEDGLGVPEGEIFCSSLKGHGIPVGQNFVEYMRKEIAAPEVVVLLLTENYFNSNFCLSELGAAWVKGHKIFPIVVPPLNFTAIKDVLLGVQAIGLEDDISYNQLRETLNDLKLVTKSVTKWDVKRRYFFQSLPGILEKLPKLETVDPAEYANVKQNLEEAKSELLSYEDEIAQLKKRIGALEKLKDTKEVQAVRREFSGSDYVAQFDTAVKAIISLRSKIGGPEVLKFMLADYYGASYGMDVRNYPEQFEEASLVKVVRLQDRSVQWGATRAQEVRQRLAEIDRLMDEQDSYDEIAGHYADRDIPFETDNLEFWESFYGV